MIGVVCDQPLVARGLLAALSSLEPDVRGVGWSERHTLADDGPRVVVAHIEPHIPTTHWMSLVSRVPVVAVVRATEVHAGLSLLRSGVTVILGEQFTDDQLRGAVTHASCGVVALGPELLSQTLRLLQEHARARHLARRRLGHLSGRERELLAMIGAGCGNVQIAARRGTAQSTVKAQVRDLLRTLGGCSRFEAALLAVSAGLVTTDHEPVVDPPEADRTPLGSTRTPRQPGIARIAMTSG